MANLSEYLVRSNQGVAYYKEGSTTLKLVEATKIDATITVEIHDYTPLGTLITKHYPGAISIKGTMELYFCSSYLLEKIRAYKSNGTPFYFDLQVINGNVNETYSISSSDSIGHQDVTLKNVLLNTLPITQLGTDTSANTISVDFVADDFYLNSSFQTINRV